MPGRFSVAVLVTATALALGGCESLGSIPGVDRLAAPATKADPAALKPGRYTLDPTHAFLDFSVNHMQFSELKGRFDQFDVSLKIDETDITSSSVAVDIDMTSLFLSSEEFSNTLKGKDWFDTGTYPTATFTSTEITLTGETKGTMKGLLSLHGKTVPVDMDIVFNGGALVPITGKYTVGFTASGVFKRSDFGIDAFTALVSDDVTLRFSGEFHRE